MLPTCGLQVHLENSEMSMTVTLLLAAALATASLVVGTAVPASAGQWITCTRNKETGQRGWALGARYVDLGTSVPFRPTHQTEFPNPKYQLAPNAEVGQCLIPDQMLRDMMK